MEMDINVIDTAIAIVGGIIGIAVSIITVYSYIKKDQFDLFNSTRIQTFKIPEYEHTILKQKMIDVLFMPSGSLFLWILIFQFLWDKIPRLIIVEAYLISCMVLLVFQDSKRLSNLKKLREICERIKCEEAKQILVGEESKNNVHVILMVSFLLIIPTCLIFSYNEYAGIVFLVGILFYVVLIIFTTFRYLLYKSKVYIEANPIIKLDYTEGNNCLCNIKVKSSYSFKIENDIIIIYYPGDIGTYIIPQKHLISAQVGYKVIDINAKKEQKE